MFVWVELEGESAVRFTNVSGRGRGGEGESGVEDGRKRRFSGVGEEGSDRIGVVHCAIFDILTPAADGKEKRRIRGQVRIQTLLFNNCMMIYATRRVSSHGHGNNSTSCSTCCLLYDDDDDERTTIDGTKKLG